MEYLASNLEQTGTGKLQRPSLLFREIVNLIRFESSKIIWQIVLFLMIQNESK